MKQPDLLVGYHQEKGIVVNLIDAISEQAAAFYEAHGFVRLPESLRLVLPMRAIEKLLTP
jgi:hypothetical protein